MLEDAEAVDNSTDDTIVERSCFDMMVDSGILDPEKSDKRAKRDSLDMLTEAGAAADVVDKRRWNRKNAPKRTRIKPQIHDTLVFGLKLLGGDFFYVNIHVRFDDIIRLQQLRQRQSVPVFRSRWGRRRWIRLGRRPLGTAGGLLAGCD